MNLLQDVRFGIRMLAKTPGFSAVIVVVLALGIGANTTVFTLVNAVLFKGLPFAHPEEIMHIGSTDHVHARDRMGVSYPDFTDWRAQSKSFKDLSAIDTMSIDLSDKFALPERFNGAHVSANAFGLIGQKPLLGRDFTAADGKPGAPAVCIIGYGIWKSRYGGALSAIGASVRLNEVPATIIGVMPQGMKFPVDEDIWAPLMPTGHMLNRDNRGLLVFGRLADGVGIAGARADLDTIAIRIEKQYPKENQGIRAAVKPYNDAFNGGPVRVVFLALLGAVGFVLLIACANVANLLLSRSLNRTREVSIRSALGASRWRVMRQFLIESVLLSTVGGLVGLLLAVWGVHVFAGVVANTGKPYWIDFTMDFKVFGYFAAIALVTGILFGLAPALHASRIDLNESLKEGGRSSSGGSRIKYLSGALVVGELAMAVVLLSGAGLMIRSFLNLYSMDVGMQKSNVLTMRYILADAKYTTDDSARRFHERLLAGLQSLPGVESASLVSHLPLQGSGGVKYEIEGEAPVAAEKRKAVSIVVISPEYFQTCGVRVIRGRAFNAADGTKGNEAVIINQRFAGEHWHGADPLGKHLRLFMDDNRQVLATVVGIAPRIRQNDPTRVEGDELAYLPIRQEPWHWMAAMARTKVPPATLASGFRKEVQKLDENMPVSEVQTLEESLARTRWAFRVFGSLFAIFAGIALVLACVGLYAVMAYSVNQRRQEIGVRIALGASRSNVLRLVFVAGIRRLAIGMALGLAGAFAVTRVLKSLLVQVSPTDPVTFISISGLLCVIALLACWIPTRRAMRIDPMTALRYE